MGETAMKKRTLHIGRLREAMEKIPELLSGDTNALAPEFQDWRSRTQHSLNELFREEHHYAREFSGLSFWLTRVVPVEGLAWTDRDEERFQGDLQRTETILRDALEEAAVE
jgi:hypothetical protein